MKDQCNCNQGRLPCTCDGWPKANHETGGVLLIAAVAIAVIMGGYCYLRYLIGVQV